MKICIFGAGAVGGHLAVKLANKAAHDVAIVSRGEQLLAIRRHGLTLHVQDQIIHARVQASDKPSRLGRQDVVFVTLKATALPQFADAVAPLLGPETAVVFVQNGVPWWYAMGLSASRPAPPDLSRLDPGSRLARAVRPDRVIGSVIYTSNEVVSPGVVKNDSFASNTILLGEPDDSQSPRVAAVRAALVDANIGSPFVSDIRATLWRKLIVNISGSSVCAILEQPVGPAFDDPAVAQLQQCLMAEGMSIAKAHGVDVSTGSLPSGPPHRFPPDHRPSLLQDYERMRPMEVESILKVPQAFARRGGVSTPFIDTIAALVAHRATSRGLYGL